MNGDIRDKALASYVWRHASLMALEADQKGRIAALNAYAARLFGPDAQGRHLLDLLSAFTAPASFGEFRDQTRSAQPMSFSTVDDEVVSLYVTTVPVDGGYLVCGQRDEQELLRLQKNLFHMTNDLNNLARELHQANAKLERSNAVKNTFLAMAAHDLRSPIGGLHSYCTDLIEDIENLKMQDMNEFLMLTKNASQYVLSIVNDLLEMTTIESGRLNMQMRRANLREIAADCLRLNAMLARNKDIDIISTFDQTDCVVSCDPHKIEQVINNLLSNAVKFSHPMGRVDLRIEQEGHEAVVSVCDNGIGVDEAEQKRIFEPFETVGLAAAGGEKCSGLGLAIASKIVHGHGGRIWVESVKGEGACFRFSLPLAP